LAIVADQHVRGLNVSMNDQIGMRLGYGAEHIEEDTNTRLYIELASFAIFIDGLSLHVLQNEIRFSMQSDPGIDQLRDVWMCKLPKNPSFTPEPRNAAFGRHRKPQELDGHALLKTAVAAFG
jgi:hypothetical protein